MVNITTRPASGSVEFDGSVGSAPTPAATTIGYIWASGTNNVGLYYTDGAGTTKQLNPAAGSIGGSVSANYIPYASSADTLANFTSVYTEADNIIMGTTPASITTDADGNTSLGAGALNKITDGDKNVAVGMYAARSGTTAKHSVAVGNEAARLGITGNYNVSVGYQANYSGTKDSNVVIGYQAAVDAGTQTGSVSVGYRAARYPQGNNNTAIGMHALLGDSSTTTGYSNVAIGRSALESMSSGYQNVAIGNNAGDDITTAIRNVIIGASAVENSNTDESVIIGAYAGFATTTAIDSSVIIGTYAAQNGSPSNAVILGRQAGYYASGAGNTYMGYQSGFGDASTNGGTYNTAVGYEAMENVQDADENVAVGSQALRGNTSGDGNTAIGTNALYVNTTANHNVAVGHRSMFSSTTATQNVAVGKSSLYSNTTGSNNVALGYEAMKLQTTGNYNVAVGTEALYTNVDGDYNTAIGYRSLFNYEPGDGEGYNIAIGAESMLSGTTGEKNISIGYHSLWRNTIGDNNVAVGHEAGRSTYSTTSGGSNNTFMGYRAAYYGSHASGAVAIGYRAGRDFGYNNAAEGNTAVGYQAGFNTTNAENVTLVGATAGAAHSHGNYSTAVGVRALYGVSGQTSGYNTAIGAGAMRYASGSQYNVAIGDQALSGASTGLSGDMNVAIGRQTMAGATTASYNTILGYSAGNAMTSGDENTFVGYHAGKATTTTSYNVFIGNGAAEFATTAQKSVVIGRQAMGAAAATGDDNTIVGYKAGYDLTTGYSNVVMGYATAENITEGHKNVILGHRAGDSITTAHSNIAIGYETLNSTTLGSENVAIGAYAGQAVVGGNSTTGGFNVFVGHTAGYQITGNVSYGGNTMVGHAAGYSATGADRSTGIGGSALYYADGAKYNTAVGRVAGAYAKGTGSTHVGDSSGYRVSGNYNTSVGFAALSGASSGTGYGTATLNVAIGSNAMANATSAEQSVVIGYDAGKAITTANKTIAIGYQAGESITTGGDNVLIGHQTGKNTTGQYNVMLGKGAGSANTDPNGNTFIGNNAAASNTTGYHSVVLGFQAAYSNQTSHKNTIVGYNAGQNFTDGQNTMLGYEAGYNSTTATQNTFIGTNAGRNNTTGDGNVIIGNAAGPSSTSTDSNKLYINNAAGTPLIGGDFSAKTLTFTADAVAINSSDANEPVLTLKNTHAGDSPAFITFQKDGGSAADGDEIGQIQFKGDDDGGSVKTYGDLYVSSMDVSAGTEDAEMCFRVMSGGTLTGVMSLGYDGNGFGMNLFKSSVSGAGLSQINYPNINNAYFMFGSDLSYTSGSNTWNPAGFSTDGNPDPNDSGGGQSLTMRAQSDINITAGQGGKDVGNASADITFKTASGSVQYTPAERMRIRGDGNVGIGTSSPDEKFHVYDGAITDGPIMKIQDAAANMLFEADHIYSSAATWFGNGQTLNFNAGTASGATHYGSFMRYMSGSTEIWRATDTGLGIGTTTPAFALDVNGDIRVEDAHYLRFGNDDSNSQWAIQHTGDDLNFAEVGVADNVLYLEAAGKVGMGTNNPDGGQLHIYTGIDQVLKMESSDANTDAIFKDTGGSGIIRFTTDTFKFYTDSAYSVNPLNLKGANVGIGTTAPNTLLEVLSTTNEKVRFSYDASNYLGVSVNSGGDSQLEAKTGHLTLKTDTAAHNIRADSKGDFRVDLGDSAGSYGMRVRAADGTGLLYAVSDGPIGIGTESNTTEALWITDEASPDADTNLILQQGSGGGGGYWIYNSSAAAAGLFGMNSSSNLQVYNYVQDKDIIFSVNDGGSQTTAMVIDGDVNRVGIGTSAPQQKLHVEGAFRFRDGNSSSQRLEGFGWNDNFALVVSGTDALGLVGGTPGVRFLDQSANEHLAIKESGTNHAQFMAGGENLLVMTNDKVIMDQGKGIQHAVGSVTEWLPDMAGSSLEGSITTWDKIQKIRTDDPPINWGDPALSSAKLMLPAATAGREHIIVWSENQSNLSGKTFSLNPAAGGDELWKAGVSGPVGINKNTGESIHVICAEAGIWSVVAHT